jgi:hypothetical protein
MYKCLFKTETDAFNYPAPKSPSWVPKSVAFGTQEGLCSRIDCG